MPRINLLSAGQQHRGLWLVGTRDAIPENSLRRARGVHPTHEGSFRSRFGGSSAAAIAAAHSLWQFGGVRFQAATTVLYRNAVSLLTGLDGTRLSFNEAPPGAGQADSLFVCGGGSVDKITAAGTASEWGIAAPPDGFTATPNALQTRTINDFEGDNTVQHTAVNLVIANEATIIQEAARSMSLAVNASTIGTATRSVTVDLSTFAGPITSPDEDWIRFWFRVDEPDFLNYIEVSFSLGNTTFATDTYSKRVTVAGSAIPEVQKGITSIPGVYDDQEDAVAEDTHAPTPDERIDSLNEINQTFIPPERNAWVQLELPKSTFKRSGDAAVDWSDMQAYRITVSTNSNGGVVCYVDLLELAGGFGLQGRYRYHVTYRNTTTGHRSNANPTRVEVSTVGRRSIALANLPVSADTQVDRREIWRTLGGGSQFFLAGTVNDNVTTTFTDDVADFDGLDSSGASVLDDTELPTDNGKPPDTIDDALWDGRAMFWLDSAAGQGGRVRYSPLGRPEADKGFIEVTPNLVKLALFNGIRYVFSTDYLYRIDGADPYTSRRVFGIPGCEAVHKHTVVVTPFGIVWRAADGVRLFDGARSVLLSEQQLDPIFDNEAIENLTSFAGTVADYGRNEYIISDTTQGLAYHLGKRRWRDLGVGFTAIHYERDSDVFTIGTSDDVEFFETPGATFSGPFAIESPALTWQDETLRVVERVHLDGNTGGQAFLTELVHKDGTTTLTPFNTTSRLQRTEELNRLFQVLSIRLSTDSLSGDVDISGVNLEVRELVCVVWIGDRRFTVPGHSSDLSVGIDFTFPPELIDAQRFIPLIKTLEVEANTNGATLSGAVTLEEGSSFGMLNFSSVARHTQAELFDRVGRVVSMSVTGDFTANMQIFAVTLYMRSLPLQVMVQRGQPTTVQGEINALGTSISFDLEALIDDQQFVPVIESFELDADTGSVDLTPTLTLDNGDTIALTAINTLTRRNTVRDVDRIGRVTYITVAGNFTGVKMYAARLRLRPLRLGLLFGGARIDVDGEIDALATSITFRVDTVSLPGEARLGRSVFRRLYLDADQNGVVMRPRLVFDNQTLDLASYTDTLRGKTEWAVGIADRLVSVVLVGDLSQSVNIYRLEADFYVPELQQSQRARV